LSLPHEIKDLANDMLPFRNALKRFLLANSFYNSKEYFNYRRRFIVIKRRISFKYFNVVLYL
jgi:hypothetical protein